MNHNPVLHKGVNTIELIQSNFYYLTMTHLNDDGKKHEVSISYGDSGSGALYEKDGQRYTIGVASHLYVGREDGDNVRYWGNYAAYVRTDGASL